MENNDVKRLDMNNKNLVQENINKIKELFPNVISEDSTNGQINFDLLKKELGIDDNNIKEKYELTWVGKSNAILEANKQINKTLRPVKEKSVNFDDTKNIYIEGDNLEALKILQESYLNKIKFIYIDPPYNTGKDFVYRDNYRKTEEEELEDSGITDEYGNKLITNYSSDGKFHSIWLSMMYSRLKLARNLMSEDGAIFISIDDNEYHNLKRLCDEIFGESNYLLTDHIQTRYKDKDVANNGAEWLPIIEYVLIYAKNKSKFKVRLPEQDYDLSMYKYEIQELNPGKIIEVGGKKIEVFKKEDYLIKELEEPSIKGLKEVWGSGSLLKQKNTAAWYYNEYLLSRLQEDGVDTLYKIYNMGEDGLGYRYVKAPQQITKTRGKIYQGMPLAKANEFINGDGAKKRLPIVNYYDYSADFGNIRHEGNITFNSGKKPTKMLKQFMQMLYGDDYIVLDFFGGSSSTAHAVLSLNSEDEGNRKFITIQIPENCENNGDMIREGFKTICDLGEERIRRSANKIKEETNADIDYGFRVYKVDSSNMKNIYYEPSKLNQAQLNMFESNIKEDRTSEDLLTQVILDLGLTLDLSIEEKNILNNKVYFVAGNSLVACFDNQINIDILNQICEIKPLKVVFRESSFRNDSDKINAYERIKKLSPETEISVI